MKIDGKTRLFEVTAKYPFLLDHLRKLSPMYENLKDDDLQKKMASVATFDMVASMGSIEVSDLIESVAAEVLRVTGDAIDHEMSEENRSSKARVQTLKGIVLDLHKGMTVDEVKGRFMELVKDVDTTEIARMEQALIEEEGIPEEEIKRLCDVHVQVFKETLDRKEVLLAPPGHPVHTFIKENSALEGLLTALNALQGEMGRFGGKAPGEKAANISGLIDTIGKVDLHYLRKENQLFPVLERKGVKGPPQVMWAVHDDVRKLIKGAKEKASSGSFPDLVPVLREMSRMMKDMIYKEEKVLFPLCMEKFSDADWARVRKGEEEIGYAWVRPDIGWEPPADVASATEPPADGGKLRLDEGTLTLEQVNAMLKALPVDISFVDEGGKVAYYSATDDRIFPRSPGVIGRDVKNCHPPKSVHIVQRILDSFKAGRKDVAEFWLELGGRFLHIRYFPVRSRDGRFLGTLEVTQDVTAIRKLEGQKRLLDWE